MEGCQIDSSSKKVKKLVLGVVLCQQFDNSPSLISWLNLHNIVTLEILHCVKRFDEK